MDKPSPIILKVATPAYKKLIVDASNGKRYHSDLSSFAGVYCFPKNLEDWQAVSRDGAGLALIWSCRFEVHIDQVIGLATKIEDSSQSA
jgi:hypothetical protein